MNRKQRRTQDKRGTAPMPQGRADSIQATFAQAVQHHQAGRLGEAEWLYQQILAVEPRHADSLHLLGVVASQNGRHDLAVQLIGKAVAIFPKVASYHANLGLALKMRGAIGDAVTSWRKSLALAPDNPEVCTNLGNALLELGRLDEAAACHRKAIALRPDYAEAHTNLGAVLQQQGRLNEAVACLRSAIALRPNYAEAHTNLGIALKKLGILDEAIAHWRQSLALVPNNPEPHTNLGLVLQDLGRLDEAIAYHCRAIDLKLDYPEAHTNLGLVLQELGRLDEAVACHGKAIDLRPDFPEAHTNLGAALEEQGRLDEAVACYRRAIDLKPDYPAAYTNLGLAFKELGRLDEVIACYRRTIELKPDCAVALAGLIHELQHRCCWEDLADRQRQVIQIIRRRQGQPLSLKDAPAPFVLLALPSTPADQLACAEAFSAGYRRAPPPAVVAPRDRIRIGYLSADFHDHATAYLIAELIERHDRDRFEVIGYSIGPNYDDDMRRRLVAAFDRFVDLRPLSYPHAAERIRRDDIDILVDLKGYTQNARTKILALRPAPIQVNFLGYPGTMGCDFIDYVIADPVCIPPDQDAFYREKVVRLPDCYQPNDTRRVIAEPSPSRSDCALPEQGFVFCSFNNSYKITPALFDIWMRLLTAVPGSVLWLLEANEWVEANLRREATTRGVEPDRLVFSPRRPLPDHLARHHCADLFLDTLPYNAHTTASDALWTGLPVLTCRGETFAGRVAASLLTAIGAPELITQTLAEYESMALRLANDPAALSAVREKIRRNRATAALFDTARYTRNIETAYGRIWERHRSGLPAETFDVANGTGSRRAAP